MSLEPDEFMYKLHHQSHFKKKSAAPTLPLPIPLKGEIYFKPLVMTESEFGEYWPVISRVQYSTVTTIAKNGVLCVESAAVIGTPQCC